MVQPSVLLHHHNLIQPLVLARDLRERGYRVEACADRANSALRHSRHVSAFHVVPPLVETERFVNAICELVRRRHIGMFLPGTDQVFALGPYRDRLAVETRYPFEGADTLARVHDKLSLQGVLERAGLLTPRAVRWDLGPLPAELRYPVVVKDVAGSGAVGLQIVRNDEELDEARVARRASGVPAMLQEFVAGRQLNWMGILHEGRLAASYAGERTLLVPAQAGPTALRRSLRIPELDRQGERLLSAIPYRGFASLDLIQDGGGRFWFLDFNPRFCAAFHASLRCGISFADVLYQLVHGGTPSAPAQKENVYSLSLARLAQRFRRSPGAVFSSVAALRHLGAAEEFYPCDWMPLAAAGINRLRVAYVNGTHGNQCTQPRTDF